MANFRFGSNDYTVNIRAQQQVNFFQGWDVHRLALAFEVTAHDNYTVDAPFLVSGNLWTHEMPGPASWIGVLHAPGPIGLKSFGTMLTLETTVTDQLLRGLEKTRAGADLTLRADLTLTGLAETKHWPVATDQEIIRIPHATWSNALTQLDAGAFVDVLVPITTVEARATAARRIREAKTAIRDQRYEHAVTLARAALDAVREACDTQKVYARAAAKTKAADRNQEERWAVLIQGAFNLFSGAPHDDSGTTENFTWTRSDAVAAVATAAGLLARLEDLP
ncbi:hypothetical protein [Streptomyces lunaelactis]|uniref:hypothetical protein n=1 Tax=Streptomyces lunaelactis TaxID=1535768 RepID=UPI001585C757|nr:hypothetical protein [Streptomyces lunaelactis]NUK03231.1 hypothetical protein [Streptomyces lunaelactis]NUK18211.1 hypothetical protein [Streptomyces lunaelactis]